MSACIWTLREKGCLCMDPLGYPRLPHQSISFSKPLSLHEPITKSRPSSRALWRLTVCTGRAVFRRKGKHSLGLHITVSLKDEVVNLWEFSLQHSMGHSVEDIVTMFQLECFRLNEWCCLLSQDKSLNRSEFLWLLLALASMGRIPIKFCCLALMPWIWALFLS